MFKLEVSNTELPDKDNNAILMAMIDEADWNRVRQAILEALSFNKPL